MTEDRARAADEDSWAALGAQPRRLARPDTREALAAEIRSARAARLAVLPMGCGTRLGAGAPPARVDLALSTAALGRIVQYEPRDLTITVEAGCGLAALGAALRERGQFLPLQTSRGRGTIGGLIATAPEGALAAAHGRVRDRLLGVTSVLADGSTASGGGRVVKNVAGYALHRLMAGSFGTLGVLVQASFKVQPMPEASGTRIFAFAARADAFAAARLALDSGTEPVFADVLAGGAGARLAVGFEGSNERVARHLDAIVDLVTPARSEGSRLLSAQEDALLRRALDDPEDLDLAFSLDGLENDCVDGGRTIRAIDGKWTDGEQTVRGGAESRADRDAGAGAAGGGAGRTGRDVACAIRVRTLPSRLEQSLDLASRAAAAEGATVLAAARPALGALDVLVLAGESKTLARAAAALLASAREGGHAAIVSAPAGLRASVDPWGKPPDDFFLMRRIKDALDPEGVFASGRFVGGL